MEGQGYVGESPPVRRGRGRPRKIKKQPSPPKSSLVQPTSPSDLLNPSNKRLLPSTVATVDTTPVKKAKEEPQQGEVKMHEETDIATIEGLTPYEQFREPRSAIVDNAKTTLRLRTLNVELTCPVCLGIIRKAVGVMECLHRFCASCISKSLRLGKKECPTCRVKCPSHRYLRPDTNLDGIIAALYPNLEEYEAQHDSLIQSINSSVNHQARAQSIMQGLQRQAQHAKSRKRDTADEGDAEDVPRQSPKEKKEKPKTPTKPKESEPKWKEKPKSKAKGKIQDTVFGDSKQQSFTDDNSSSAHTSTAVKKAQSSDNEVCFLVERHSKETRLGVLEQCYLKTSSQLTMLHLSKFLAKKFGIEDFTRIKVMLNSPETVLLPAFTVGFVQKELWRKDEDMVLLYYLEE